jgi:TolB-like protein
MDFILNTIENEKIVIYYKKSSFIGGESMRKMAFCILAMLIGAGLYGQQPVVAVAPFDAISGISATDANMITRVFFIRLGNTNKVSLVDRNVVDRVLREHSFQAGDWSNEQKTAELGKALNSDWIVRGELEKFGSNILVTVQFYDIQTFRFMGGGDLRIANIDEAYDKMDPLVDKLVQTIGSSGSQPIRQTQGGNAGASDYYGTWQGKRGTYTINLIIEANTITCRVSNGDNFIISNCTWTASNNSDRITLADNPSGFKVSGVVTDIKGYTADIFMPVYLFIHKSDKNKIEFFNSLDSKSEAQDVRFWNISYQKV